MEREWSEGRTHREAVVVEPQRGDSPRIAPGACAARLREPLAHSCATNSAIGDDVVVVLEAGVEEAHAVPAAGLVQAGYRPLPWETAGVTACQVGGKWQGYRRW